MLKYGYPTFSEKSNNQCFLLLSYELLCSFPWLVALEYIFWGAFTSPATPWFELKIPEVKRLETYSLPSIENITLYYTLYHIYIYIYIYIYIQPQLLYGLESKLLRLQTYSLSSINCEVNLPYSACFLKCDSPVKKLASHPKRENNLLFL